MGVRGLDLLYLYLIFRILVVQFRCRRLIGCVRYDADLRHRRSHGWSCEFVGMVRGLEKKKERGSMDGELMYLFNVEVLLVLLK